MARAGALLAQARLHLFACAAAIGLQLFALGLPRGALFLPLMALIEERADWHAAVLVSAVVAAVTYGLAAILVLADRPSSVGLEPARFEGDERADAEEPEWGLDVSSALRTGAFPDAGGFNSGYYSNPKVDELLEAARSSTDQAERAKLYKEMQEIVQEDAPWVFVANWKQSAVIGASVQGFKLQPSFFLMLHDVSKQ